MSLVGGRIVEVYDRLARDGEFTIRLAKPVQSVVLCKVTCWQFRVIVC